MAHDTPNAGPQLRSWAVCQVCGYAVPMHEATPEALWLVGDYHPVERSDRATPYSEGLGLKVVRCPRHISDHALRISVGRTNEWRDIMRRGRDWEPPPFWEMQPIPAMD